MLRTIFRDPERYKTNYLSQIEGMYFTGDGARRDEDGYFWIMGRVDDVINVSGHRLSTMEVESALVSHQTVAEAACVGKPDEVKGQGIVAFVTLEGGRKGDDKLREELSARGQGDRRARASRRDSLHRRAAEDAQRQNHAPAAAPDRGGRRDPRRHHDARRSVGDGRASARTKNKVAPASCSCSAPKIL